METETDDETSVTTASSIMDQEIHNIPEDVLFDLEEDILAEIDDFIKSNLELYSNPDFEEQIADYRFHYQQQRQWQQTSHYIAGSLE